ncbi:hypothetical protein RN001_008647 [Aquatica leii]|uniref:Cytochrome P450 n=1 Tax=Aquatica leii TaxID=1421715 RepID=A0AAN7S9S5_9COLE|nr:hypothetical protein RN001_008647 [Aquatica leii]
MLMYLLWFCISFLTILIILWFIVFLKYEFYLRKFSGPMPLPIIGSLHHIGIKQDLLPSISKLTNQHGHILKFMFGFRPKVFVSDAKFVEFILSSNTILRKSYDYNYLHLWLGMGLLTSFGKKWKRHRKLLTPAFHFKILERFIDVFDNKSNILITKLEKLNEKEPIDIFPYITLYTLDVICEAIMETSVNAQLNPKSDYVKSVKEVCRIMMERAFSVKMWDIFFRFSKDYHKEKKAVDVLHGLSNSVIRDRSQKLENKELTDSDNTSYSELKHKMAFLDLLLTSTIDDEPLSHNTIREEVDTFMFEGHDTTSSGISFTLYCMSKHQEIQDKVFAEITKIVGDDKNVKMSYEHLQKMKYLEQVIKETFRLYPPVPMFTRVLTKNATFQNEILPKNLVVAISVYNLHRNAALYPKPDVFDPERFNAENSKNISLYSYVPFSAGPRNCIGQKFAMLEVKAAVTKILRLFKVLPVVEHQPVLIANAILTSDNGLPVRLEKRF